MQVLLGLVAVLCVLVFLVAALNTVGCCAIDPDKFPEKVAANRRHQRSALFVAWGSAVIGCCAVTGAFLLRPPRRHPGEAPAHGDTERPAR